MQGIDCDSMLVFDLRGFAREYAGTPLSRRLSVAANELDRLHEFERVHATVPEGYLVTDELFHATALTLRSWLPGDLLLGTVERALREALKAHCIQKTAPGHGEGGS